MKNDKCKTPKIVARWHADNVDYDYPQCGGTEVSVRLMSDGTCQVKRTYLSNYQGCRSGQVYIEDITGGRTHAIALAQDLTAPDGEGYLDPAEYYLADNYSPDTTGRCLSRGYIVR